MFNRFFNSQTVDILFGLSEVASYANEKLSENARKSNREYLEEKLFGVDLAAFRDNIQAGNFELDVQGLKQLWSEYKSNRYLRSFLNYFYERSSSSSRQVKNMDTDLHSSAQRVQKIVNYMVNKDNWQYGFCRFLWEQHFSGNFLFVEHTMQEEDRASESLTS